MILLSDKLSVHFITFLFRLFDFDDQKFVQSEQFLQFRTIGFSENIRLNLCAFLPHFFCIFVVLSSHFFDLGFQTQFFAFFLLFFAFFGTVADFLHFDFHLFELLQYICSHRGHCKVLRVRSHIFFVSEHIGNKSRKLGKRNLCAQCTDEFASVHFGFDLLFESAHLR